MIDFGENRDPIFRGTCALGRGHFEKQKEEEEHQIHYKGDSPTAELSRVIVSVNQLFVFQ